MSPNHPEMNWLPPPTDPSGPLRNSRGDWPLTSEYNAWFRKRPDLIEKYCTRGTGWNPGEYAYILNEYQAREHT